MFAMLKTSIPRKEGAPRRTGRLTSKFPYQLDVLIHGSHEGRREVPHRGRRGRESRFEFAPRGRREGHIARTRRGRYATEHQIVQFSDYWRSHRTLQDHRRALRRRHDLGKKPTRTVVSLGATRTLPISPLFHHLGPPGQPQKHPTNNDTLIRRREQSWRCVRPTAYVAAPEASAPSL